MSISYCQFTVMSLYKVTGVIAKKSSLLCENNIGMWDRLNTWVVKFFYTGVMQFFTEAEIEGSQISWKMKRF